MAHAFVVNLNHGGDYSSVGYFLNGDTSGQTVHTRLYDGQYIFLSETYPVTKFTIWDYQKQDFVNLRGLYTTDGSGDPGTGRLPIFDAWGNEVGYIQRLANFNCSRFPSTHCAHTGSKYRLRYDGECGHIINDAGGNPFFANERLLKAGCHVVIGAGQGYTGSMGYNYLRIYGYYDLEGDWTETSNMYFKETSLGFKPGEYKLLTE